MKPSLLAVRGTHKGVLIAVIILSAFLFLLFAVVFSYQTSLETKVMSPLISPFVKYHVYFIISVGALGVAVGATVFYFMSQKVATTQVVAKKSTDIMLRFLSREEQLIIKRLVEQKGQALQAELSRQQGLNKVKVHRIVQKLAEKQIVTLDQYGKTNTVYLQQEIYDALA